MGCRFKKRGVAADKAAKLRDKHFDAIGKSIPVHHTELASIFALNQVAELACRHG